MFDLIREILQTLRSNRLRTSLTGFAIVWGIFMLIVLLGISRGVYNSFNYHAMNNGARLSIYNGYTSIPYKGLKENRFINMRSSDMEAITRDNPQYIDCASADMSLSGNISTQRDFISGGATGVFPQHAKNAKIDMAFGRFINERDMQERRKVIVISHSDAEILFPGALHAVGSHVKFMDMAFTVIGVHNENYSRSFIPFSTAQMLKNNDGKISSITLSTKGLENVEQAEELEDGVRQTLGRRHMFDANDQSAIWIWNQFIQQKTMLGGLGILNIAIWIIGIFTLLTGIVGVSNIMFVSVRERTHEIGIRRAIGARPRSILLQIILESVSITAIFGYIGVFLGICLTEVLSMLFANSDFMKDPTVDINIAVSVTVVLIVSGCLAGIFPAMKALKVKPVEALRTE